MNNMRALWNILILLEYPMQKWQMINVHNAIAKSGSYYISAMRQLGKTHLGIAFTLLCCLAGYKGLYLAHDGKTVDEIANKMFALSDRLFAMKLIDQPWKPSQKTFRFKSGGWVSFRTRRGGLGVGLTLDFVVWDEAQKVKAQSIEEIIPTMTTSKFNRQLFLGTPPSKDDWRLYGETPFVIARARGGKNFKEYSLAKTYDPALKATVRNLRKCNPSAKHLMKNVNSYIKSLSENTSHMDLMRQAFGVWWYPPSIKATASELLATEVSAVMTEKELELPYYILSISAQEDSDYTYIVASNSTTQSLAFTIDTPFGSVDSVIEMFRQTNKKKAILDIRIADTAKGRTIYSALKSMGQFKNVILVSKGYHATYLNIFLERLRAKKVSINNKSASIIALSGFTTKYDPKTGLYYIDAGDANTRGLAIAHINSIVYGEMEKNINKYNSFGSLA